MFISGPDFPAAFIASEYFLPYVLFVGIFPSVFWQLCFYFSCLGWILSAFSVSTKGHWFWALLFPSYLTKGCQIALRLTHNDISLNSCFSSPHILNSVCLPSLCCLVHWLRYNYCEYFCGCAALPCQLTLPQVLSCCWKSQCFLSWEIFPWNLTGVRCFTSRSFFVYILQKMLVLRLELVPWFLYHPWPVLPESSPWWANLVKNYSLTTFFALPHY